tara:strand:- start:212 stop:421 length:210 start_codon:yes stop_codon:yes gene_type:complete
MKDHTTLQYKSKGISHVALVPDEALHRFVLLYCKYCAGGRNSDRDFGQPESGYELEDWYKERRIDDEDI